MRVWFFHAILCNNVFMRVCILNMRLCYYFWSMRVWKIYYPCKYAWILSCEYVLSVLLCDYACVAVLMRVWNVYMRVSTCLHHASMLLFLSCEYIGFSHASIWFCSMRVCMICPCEYVLKLSCEYGIILCEYGCLYFHAILLSLFFPCEYVS